MNRCGMIARMRQIANASDSKCACSHHYLGARSRDDSPGLAARAYASGDTIYETWAKYSAAEGTAGDLDDENTQVVFGLLCEVADGGAAVLVVTHEQAACENADTMLTMSSGVLSR